MALPPRIVAFSARPPPLFLSNVAFSARLFPRFRSIEAFPFDVCLRVVAPWLLPDELLDELPTVRLVEEVLSLVAEELLFTVLRCVEELLFTAPSDVTTVLRLLLATEPGELVAGVCEIFLRLP